MLSFKQLIFTFYFCKIKSTPLINGFGQIHQYPMIFASFNWMKSIQCCFVFDGCMAVKIMVTWFHMSEKFKPVFKISLFPACTRFCWFSRKTWHHQNHHDQPSWFAKGEGQPPKLLGISVILCSHWSVKFGIVRIQWTRAC